MNHSQFIRSSDLNLSPLMYEYLNRNCSWDNNNYLPVISLNVVHFLSNPCFLVSFFFFRWSISFRLLSLWHFPFPQFNSAGVAGDFTLNWLNQRPLLEASSRSTSSRDLGCEWRFVSCSPERGALASPLSSATGPSPSPLSTMPECFGQSSQVPGPDRSDAVLPNSVHCFSIHSRKDSKLASI